jgi:hypothetical protein
LRPDPPPASLSARAGASGRPLWLWLAARFVLAGVLPLLLVGALLLVVYLPQARVDIDNRQQVLAGAISGQVELHLLGAERELSTIAAHLRRPGRAAAAVVVFFVFFVVFVFAFAFVVAGCPGRTPGRRRRIHGDLRRRRG